MGLIISDHKKRWPGGCVIWRFHPGLSDAEQVVFRRAMDHWIAEGRDVRFLERTTQDSFVEFRADGDIDNVNHSDIGMVGGEQAIWLEPLTDAERTRKRASRHEIGHTLGFHHEHVRCDRDNFVAIDMSKIPLTRYFDYDRRCGGEYQPVGDYDFGSIMHYNPRKSSTVDHSTDIVGVDAASAVLLANTSRSSVSSIDTQAVAKLHGGNAHIYQLSGNGQIERTIQQYNWSSGWTIATPYRLDVRNYILLLKRSGGRMQVYALNADGSLGGLVDDQDWSDGWTAALKYTIGPINYLLLYKRQNGAVHLNRINLDGSIGGQVEGNHDIEPGWTSIRHYALGLQHFLILVNATTGEMRVRSIDWDGTIGGGIGARTWSPGWTTVEPYSVGGNNFLLLLKASTGEVIVRDIRSGGMVGNVDKFQSDWSAGWSTALPYEAGGVGYLLRYRASTGDFNIRRLRSNGTVGPVTDQRMFGPGWSLVRTYHVGLAAYALFIKAE